MVHGGEGTFLSSLAALSVLTITSHHEAHNSHASLILHHSRPAARLVPAPLHHHLSNREHGTRITVQELFGNMPVRVKQRATMYGGREHAKQWEVLSKQIVGLLLAWNVSVMFTLNSPESARKLSVRRREGQSFSPSITAVSPRSIDLSLIRSILSQAAYIEPSGWDNWIETSARSTSVTIWGAISLEPAPSKKTQFLSLGIQYINPEAHNFLYDEINHIFAASDFGGQEGMPGSANRSKLDGRDGRSNQSGFTNKQLRGGGKGVDRWPMFFIRADLQSQSNARSKSNFADLDMASTLSIITNALEAMLIRFLKDHHFRPRTKRLRKPSGVASELAPGADLCNAVQFETPPDSGIKMGTTSCSDALHQQVGISDSSTCKNACLPKNLARSAERCHMVSTSVDALSTNIKLPTFTHRNIRLDGRFSSWSRIKSGKGDGSQELSRRNSKTAEQSRNIQGKDNIIPMPTPNVNDCFRNPLAKSTPSGMNWSSLVGDNMNQNRGRAQDSILDEEATASRVMTGETMIAEHEDVAEEAITWTNPVSRASFSINARTGLVVPRLFGKFPSNLRSDSSLMNCFESTANQKRLTRTVSAPFGTLGTGLWAKEFLKTWNNPVFSPSEDIVPYVSFDGTENSFILQGRNHRCSDIDVQKAFTQTSSLFSAKFSKDALRGAHVIAQFDKKFILIIMKMNTHKESQDNRRLVPERLLVLVDQHAADERVRVEGLLAELCSTPELGGNLVPLCVHPISRVATTVLAKTITFEIQAQEHNMFTRHASHFANWGILYSLSTPRTKAPAEKHQLAVKALPGVIAERCRIDPKVLIELMRGEVWNREERGITSMDSLKETPTAVSTEPDCHSSCRYDHVDWLHLLKDCPQGILDILSSRSCRSAIMFNDKLTVEECRTLIQKLATCLFPFQCAHGRPSMIPLVQLGPNSSCFDNGTVSFGNRRDLGNIAVKERDFMQAWKAWKNEVGQSGEEQFDRAEDSPN